MEHIYKNPCFGEPWFDYPELYENFVKILKNNSVIVEVGSWKGKSTSFLAVEIINSKKNIKLYAVDTWKGSSEHQSHDCVIEDSLYSIFLSNMKSLNEYFIPIRKSSVIASEDFADNSIDIVFIDASHDYESVKKDIDAWLPKIKKGGVISGHDYNWDGVKKAVDESFTTVTTYGRCWIFQNPLEEKPKKVLIATPTYDGKIDVWYANSLVDSIRIGTSKGIYLHPVWLSYDALIQRARNDLIGLAVNGEYDALIFIDADIEFQPQWIFNLLDCQESVVGGTYRKKSDAEETYTVKAMLNSDGSPNLHLQKNGLIEVQGMGTGFVKISRDALLAIWNASEPYNDEQRGSGRMVCSVGVLDGTLMSEDIMLFKKLSDLGFKIWLDPKMTCKHIMGSKKFEGDFSTYASNIMKTNNNKLSIQHFSV